MSSNGALDLSQWLPGDDKCANTMGVAMKAATAAAAAAAFVAELGVGCVDGTKMRLSMLCLKANFMLVVTKWNLVRAMMNLTAPTVFVVEMVQRISDALADEHISMT